MIYKFTSPNPTEGELKLAEAWKHLYEAAEHERQTIENLTKLVDNA